MPTWIASTCTSSCASTASRQAAKPSTTAATTTSPRSRTIYRAKPRGSASGGSGRRCGTARQTRNVARCSLALEDALRDGAVDDRHGLLHELTRVGSLAVHGGTG